MSEHIEAVPDGKGGATLKIWWDTPEENPNFGEDGQSIETRDGGVVLRQLTDFTPSELWRGAVPKVVARLHELAREKLGPGKIYEIRGKIPTDFGRSKGIAWYTAAWMQKENELFEIPYPGKLNELGGYMYLGRFKT